MDVVLNDFALAGQFKDIETFVDSLVENTFPVLNNLRMKSTILWKSQETYSKHITAQETLYDFLCSQRFYGFPEAQMLRKFLGELMEEPYWEDTPMTDENASYSCDYTDDFKGTKPNCFSEALERDGVIFSLEHKDFSTNEIGIKKNGNANIIFNVYNKSSVGKALFLKDMIGFTELLLCGIKSRNIVFFSNQYCYYTDEYYNSGKLSKMDAFAIQEDFQKFVEGQESGTVLSRFTDSITYKNITYCEFRTTISNKREFRLFYILDGSKTVFINSLIKTTKVTPDTVKERTCALIKQYRNAKEL